ncbi:hypothetical protein RDWZM_000988 [Blomia tropicalis]|uniref:Uncharacterized protein n=1 Tax=Blomia tropicalis TaxID=40697 RepID=A0A9Q0RNI4_BLOTA|nr:hypothetical protein RDWZM_000988 [Blomia tropicalis]
MSQKLKTRTTQGKPHAKKRNAICKVKVSKGKSTKPLAPSIKEVHNHRHHHHHNQNNHHDEDKVEIEVTLEDLIEHPSPKLQPVKVDENNKAKLTDDGIVISKHGKVEKSSTMIGVKEKENQKENCNIATLAKNSDEEEWEYILKEVIVEDTVVLMEEIDEKDLTKYDPKLIVRIDQESNSNDEKQMSNP